MSAEKPNVMNRRMDGIVGRYRNMLDRTGATPFLLVAKSADLPLMRALLAQGADPLLTTNDNSTPLMVAAGVGIRNVGENPGTNDEALEAVKLTHELGGSVTAVNDKGYTALHGAAHRGANELVKWLVDRGARLDAKLTKAGGGTEGTGGWRAGWTPQTIADPARSARAGTPIGSTSLQKFANSSPGASARPPLAPLAPADPDAVCRAQRQRADRRRRVHAG
jgi:hypothetical protein